jgi:flavin-dependent dehydrogenase
VSTLGSPDVVVVGAGPAGSASAILLAERGLAVLLLDKATFARPKICGEYLSPEAARLLDRLGVLKEIDAIPAQPLRGMRIVGPDGSVLHGRYPTSGRWRGYRDHALAVQREALDRILVERARSLPVDVRERHRVTDVLVEGKQVVGVRVEDADGRPSAVRAPLVVGADGSASAVARSLRLLRPRRLSRLAIVQDVEGLAGMEPLGEIYVDPPDYSILNPVTPTRVNLSLVVPLAHAKPFADRLETFFRARLKQLLHLAPRLEGMRPVGKPMAMGPLAYGVKAPRHGGVLLAGDAAGFYDPFSGEGLHTALRSAELLTEIGGDALRAGDVSRARLARYERARRAAFRGKLRLARFTQFVIARRSRSNLAARVLSGHPGLLDLFMGVIGDFIPPRELLRWETVRRAL